MLLASPPRLFAPDSWEWAHLAHLQGPRAVQLQYMVTIWPLSLNTLLWAGSGSSTFITAATTNQSTRRIDSKLTMNKKSLRNVLNFSPDRWFQFCKIHCCNHWSSPCVLHKIILLCLSHTPICSNSWKSNYSVADCQHCTHAVKSEVISDSRSNASFPVQP